ncbi:MAG TPA: hypothetical protein VGN73_14390, partial [Gemmatimonadaceae bacterium]|nr:hypothetical protein [Gemmatimonadaceae bacterium]
MRSLITGKTRRTIAVIAAGAIAIGAGVGCSAASGDSPRVARSTLVIAIDVSGSFGGKARYESAIDFAANYLYAHIHGLSGLKQPTAVFVGSVGGEKPGETKSFQPIHTFQNMSVQQISAYLRKEYPSRDGLTDFNPFFERVATLVKRQNLVLSPLNIIMLTDGIPDTPSEKNDSLSKYKKISVSGLEYLSKNTTLRILYPRPTVAVHWEKNVPRRRVRMWTVDDEVMATWRSHYHAG